MAKTSTLAGKLGRASLSFTHILLLLLVLFFAGVPVKADTVDLGLLSFNTFIPSAPGSPGINGFGIDNSTGGFALPPTFPAADSLTFLNSSLTVDLQGGGQQVIPLGDLAPGSYTPSSVQFSATTNFLAATFTATLSSTTFALSDGSRVTASTPNLSVELLPSSGQVLQADTDLAYLAISESLTVSPEPSYTPIVIGVLAALFLKFSIVAARHRARQV